MIDRRSLSLLLLGGAAGLAGCASGDGPPPGGPGGEGGGGPEGEDMLFISPMGEPFRAKQPAPYPVDLWFKGADKNGDGKLDVDEFQADAERFFHVLDITKDGVIDHREIYYYEHNVVPEVLGQQFGRMIRKRAGNRLWLASDMQLAQMAPGAGNSGGGAINGDGMAAPEGRKITEHPLVGAAIYGLLADPEPVQGSDIRLTGAITLADFKTRAQQRFEILDQNKKGFLPLDTLPETEAQRMMPKPRRGRRGPPPPPRTA